MWIKKHLQNPDVVSTVSIFRHSARHCYKLDTVISLVLICNYFAIFVRSVMHYRSSFKSWMKTFLWSTNTQSVVHEQKVFWRLSMRSWHFWLAKCMTITETYYVFLFFKRLSIHLCGFYFMAAVIGMLTSSNCDCQYYWIHNLYTISIITRS